jgi:hypothetical protein
VKCKIQWIDDNGSPTPDDNEAIGTVAMRTYQPEGRGSPLDKTWGEEHPICAEHLKRMRPHHVSWPGTDHEFITEWRFTPYNPQAKE